MLVGVVGLLFGVELRVQSLEQDWWFALEVVNHLDIVIGVVVPPAVSAVEVQVSEPTGLADTGDDGGRGVGEDFAPEDRLAIRLEHLPDAPVQGLWGAFEWW